MFSFQEILNEIIVCLAVMGSEETFCDIKVRDLFWRFISTLDYFLQDLYTLIIELLYLALCLLSDILLFHNFTITILVFFSVILALMGIVDVFILF